MSKKKSENYVDNERLYREICEYKAKLREATEKGLTKPRIPPYAGESILKIAQRISYLPRFIRYSWREEMISDGIENACVYFDNFDEVKYRNPFAYLTMIIFRAFTRRILREKRSRYTTYKFFDRTLATTEAANLLRDEDNNLIHVSVYENISRYIEDFEAKERERKLKKPKSLTASANTTQNCEIGLEKFFIDFPRISDYEENPIREPATSGAGSHQQATRPPRANTHSR